jgi:hypothetical protein
MLRQAVSLLFAISPAVLATGGKSSAQSRNIFGNVVPKNPLDAMVAVRVVGAGTQTFGAGAGTTLSNPRGFTQAFGARSLLSLRNLGATSNGWILTGDGK